MIAALFVETGGCYFGLPNVDPWDRERDARDYAGPHPVVAHPPCARWGRYWGGGPKTFPRPLRWGRAPSDFIRLDDGFHSAEERARAVKTGACQRLSHKQRAATPSAFRDLLLSIAATAAVGQRKAA